MDRGFSLVELIVVIAIMAALIGVLAPAYLSYVEKTRVQSDETAAGEILRAAEIVVYSGTYEVTEMVLVTFDSGGVKVQESTAGEELRDLLIENFGDLSKIVPISKKYGNQRYTIRLVPAEKGSGTMLPGVAGSWSLLG